MNLDEVCQAVADALSTVDALTGYPWEPPTEEVPFAYVSDVAGNAATFGALTYDLQLEVTVCVSLADSYNGRSQSQELLADVLDALDGNLDGEVDSSTPLTFSSVGADIVVNNTTFKGFVVTLLVMA